MKKQRKGLLAGMALVLVLTGCSGEPLEPAGRMKDTSADSYVQAAQEALAAADSFTADFKISVRMKGSGENITQGTVTCVKEPLFMNVDTELVYEDAVQTYHVYLEEAEGQVNQYMNYDGDWTEMTMTEEAAATGTKIYHMLDHMQTFLQAGENWKMKEKGGEVLLKGTIPEEKVFSVEESGRLFQMAGMSGLSEVYFADVGDLPVELTVDAKTGKPISFEIDLAKQLEVMTNNVLTELGGGTLENSVKVSDYKITSELTQLGGVEAGEIPAEARSSAINYEKAITLLEGEEE